MAALAIALAVTATVCFARAASRGSVYWLAVGMVDIVSAGCVLIARAVSL